MSQNSSICVFGIRGFHNIQGGAEKHCEYLYPRLALLGYDIIVFARSTYFTPENKVPEYKGVHSTYLWAPRKQKLEAFIHSFLSALMCIFRRPDIVHVHNMGPGLFIPLLRIFGLRVVFTYHSINYLHQKWGFLEKLVLRLGEFLSVRFADVTIVVSQASKKLLEEKYPAQQFRYIPNGIDFPTGPVTDETLKKYGIRTKNYVLTVTRLTEEKGVQDLIDAYLTVDKPQFSLVIAGDADQETAYSRKVKKTAQDNIHIILSGFVTGKNLHELYAHAGLFVLPSYSEGLPISLLEALSYGLPVLVSNIPQNKDISLAEFRYFKTGDTEELSKKIVELFDKGIADSEAERYKIMLQNEYNWDTIAQETHRVYSALMQKKFN